MYCVPKHHVNQFMITRLNQVHANANETTLDSTTNHRGISGCLLNPAESKLPLQVPSHVKNGCVEIGYPTLLDRYHFSYPK